ncbi:hypothetical protein [Streptomyces sp. NPDC058572]|uniref:hypothetical protein n=1 Tax=Streptomyces sp. NPDC058572 TaxID=3346546 RepID=UPI003660BF0E
MNEIDDLHGCFDPQYCMTDCRAYPVPRKGRDPRFTECVVNTVAAALASHGYPPVSNIWDWSELEMALAGFLYHPHKSKETKK